MAHYAFLDENNIVTEVIVGRDETEVVDGITDWEKAYGDYRGQTCVRTSYNGNIRYNYAGVGFMYDPIDDAFIAPAPCQHDTLILNNLKRWECADCDAKALQSRATA
jgi:hypothetical protein